MSNSTNFSKVNSMVSIFKVDMDRNIYNQIAEELLPWVTNFCRQYSNTNHNIIDAETLTSISLCEALNEALLVDDYKYDFRTFLKLVMLSKFKNAIKEQMTDKRMANHKTVADTISDDDGNEISLTDTIPDNSLSTVDKVIDKMLLSELLSNLPEQEKQLLFVLMNNTGKQRGQAVASFFGQPEYNSALRVRVNRFQAKVKALINVTNEI